MVDNVGRLKLGRTTQHNFVRREHVEVNLPPKQRWCCQTQKDDEEGPS